MAYNERAYYSKICPLLNRKEGAKPL